MGHTRDMTNCTDTTKATTRGAAYSANLYQRGRVPAAVRTEAGAILHQIAPCATWSPATSEVIACTQHADHVTEQLDILVDLHSLRPFIDQIQDQS